METWIIAAGVAVVGTLAVSLVYFLWVGPAEQAEGAQDAMNIAKAKAEGLKVGADAMEKLVLSQEAEVEARAQALKARDAVDVANEIIAGKKS